MPYRTHRWLSASAAFLVGVAPASTGLAEGVQPIPEAIGATTTGYPSVEAALSALEARRDVQLSVQAGWIIVSDSSGPTLWSFAPKDHPSYPSVVKRQIVNRPDGAYVDMHIQCEAPKGACDDLVREFQALNEQMARTLRGH